MAKILLSPIDPARQARNELAQKNWASYDAIFGKPIPGDAISYVMIKGADLGRPSTILVCTRNLSTCDIAGARWVGANQIGPDGKPPKNAMAELNVSQGHLVLSDGSAKLSTDADLGSSGLLVKAHIASSGGLSVGPASTHVIHEGGGKEGGKYEIIITTHRGNLTWEEAKAAAESKGGHLMTITSSHEQDELVKLLKKHKGANRTFWIGGHDSDGDRKWEWVTGEKWKYSNWESPNHLWRDERYLDAYATDLSFAEWESSPINHGWSYGYVLEKGGCSTVKPGP